MSDQQKGKDLRNQLTDLWKTTVEQLDGLKGVIIRQSHVGRKKIDTAVLKRQRDRFLQDLGESVFTQVEAGEMSIGPEGTRLVERLRDVLDQIATAEQEISRIHQGETPEPSGEFPALQLDDLDAAAPQVGDDRIEVEAEADQDEASAQAEPDQDEVSARAEPDQDEPDQEEAGAQAEPDQDEVSARAEPDDAGTEPDNDTAGAEPAAEPESGAEASDPSIDTAAVDDSAARGDKEDHTADRPRRRRRRSPRRRAAKPETEEEDS